MPLCNACVHLSMCIYSFWVLLDLHINTDEVKMNSASSIELKTIMVQFGQLANCKAALERHGVMDCQGLIPNSLRTFEQQAVQMEICCESQLRNDSWKQTVDGETVKH